MAANTDEPNLPVLDALREMIEQGREADPLIGPKLGSQVALDLLLEQLGTERGVHAETLMAVTGLLMGQSVQACLWAEAQQEERAGLPGVHVVRCEDGTTYFVGDPLNRRLMEGYGSPWGLLSEAARQEGCEPLPEREEMLLEGIQRLGTPAFGEPEVPADHAPLALDPSEQDNLWQMVRPLCQGCCSEPGDWPLLCGLIAVRALRLVTPHLAPFLAFRLAMDSAIDAAKVPQEKAFTS
jgi:hypothetical protein